MPPAMEQTVNQNHVNTLTAVEVSPLELAPSLPSSATADLPVHGDIQYISRSQYTLKSLKLSELWELVQIRIVKVHLKGQDSCHGDIIPSKPTLT